MSALARSEDATPEGAWCTEAVIGGLRRFLKELARQSSPSQEGLAGRMFEAGRA